jgi:hypothetical protein
MADTHVLSALKSKRAEIVGYIHDLEKKVRTWRARLTHIDASMRIFSPDTDPEAIPARRTYRRSRYFMRGEFALLCLAELRKASGPIRKGEIAAAILGVKGLSVDDPALRGAIAERTGSYLRTLEKQGTVIKTGGNRNAMWEIAPVAGRAPKF